MRTKQNKLPCKTCPFRVDSKPGETGGSHPSVFVGQSYAPYRVPCHEAVDYSDPNWQAQNNPDSNGVAVAQCAGHAIFRANLGVRDDMPAGLLRLPVSSTVFTTVADFVCHHTGIKVGSNVYAFSKDFFNSARYATACVYRETMKLVTGERNHA